MKIEKYFTGQRRLLAALAAAILVYLIVNSLGEQFGISDGIEKKTMYLIILSTTVSAFVTKYTMKKFNV